LAWDTPPFGVPLKSKARWLRPVLRVRVRYLNGSGKLRHATLCGLNLAIVPPSWSEAVSID
jgi:hypothetical protein